MTTKQTILRLISMFLDPFIWAYWHIIVYGKSLKESYPHNYFNYLVIHVR